MCIDWNRRRSKLFDSWLNSLHPLLKFTLAYSIHGTIYVDLFVSTGAHNSLKTKIYSKPCDSHAYLLPSSAHPAHISKNIPIGVIKRVRRNCTDETDYKIASEQYCQYLRNRDYNEDLLEEAKTLANEADRDTLIGLNINETKSPQNKFPLIIKFNHRLQPMAKFIRENMHIL